MLKKLLRSKKKPKTSKKKFLQKKTSKIKKILTAEGWLRRNTKK